MSRWHLTYILFFIFQNINSQSLNVEKISMAMLEENYHPKIVQAEAAFLINSAETRFNYSDKEGFYQTTEYFYRIKIYRKDGLNWANFSIPYYSGNDEQFSDSVEVKECYTFNLINGKIEKTKLNDEGILTEKINDYWKKKSILMPNVKEGSIIEIRYVTNSENISKLPIFYFQYSIPVNKAHYVSEVPEIYHYKSLLKGYATITPKRETLDKSVNIERRDHNMSNYALLNYKIVRSTFELNDIEPLLSDFFIDNIDNYRIALFQELQTVRMPNKEPKHYNKSWDDVAKIISQNETFKSEINTRGYFEQQLKTLIPDSLSKTEKMIRIFKYIQKKSIWNQKLGYYPLLGLKNTFQSGVGNVADINLNLIVLMRYYGIIASPVIISTRENGKSIFPSLDGFNYLIAHATIDGNDFLMDATDKQSSINLLPIRCLNGSGFIIYDWGSVEEIQINPKQLSKKITQLQAEIQTDGKITGKIRSSSSDYVAYSLRKRITSEDNFSQKEFMEEKHNGLEIEDYSIENVQNQDEAIVEIYNFKYDNVELITSEKIAIKPLLFFTENSNPFTQDKRILPIDFQFRNQQKFIVSFTIPKGYIVESLPKSLTISLPDKMIFCNFNATYNHEKISISSQIDINESIFSPEYYQDIKNIFKQYLEKQSELIVLKKVEP